MNPRVSIIVPCYNTEAYLDCCLNSLVRQSFKDTEIILVDDGSPDRVPEMCDEWEKQDSRIKVVHKQNEGLGHARNSGLEIAAGDYIVFVDSDDYLELNAIEYLYNLCQEKDYDVLRYESNRFSKEGCFNCQTGLEAQITTISDPTTIRNMGKWLFGHNPLEEQERLFFYGSACMEMIRHSIIKEHKISFVSERDCVSEDYVFTYHCFKYCKKIGHTSATLYHYRYNHQSLSRTPKLDSVERQYKFSCMIESMLDKEGYGIDAHIIPMHHFVNELRSATKLIIRSSLSNKEKRQWFKENMKHQYIKQIYNDFPWKKLPLKEQLHFLSCYYRLYAITLLLSFFQRR